MPPVNEQQVREIIRQELGNLILTDKFVFDRLIQFLDGRDIQLGKTTGSSIGTATNQKLSFHGVTPVVQAGAISAPAGQANDLDTEARNAINSIRTALTNKGITA